MTLEAILGYVMIILIVIVLLKKWMNPVAAFAIIPPIIGLLAGYSVPELGDYIGEGVSGMVTNSTVAFFAILYFSFMMEKGLFYPIATFVTKKCGKNIPIIVVLAAALANITHLDTQATSTIMITIPTMLPIFLAAGLDPKLLYVVIAMAIATMNHLPMGGNLILAAGIGGTDSATLFSRILPLMVVSVIFNLVLAYFLGVRAQRKGRYVKAEGIEVVDQGLVWDSDMSNFKIDWKYWTYVVITALIFVAICVVDVPAYLPFMIGFALATIVDFGFSAKKMNAVIDKYARNGFKVGMVMLSAGIFSGVLTESTMISSMTSGVSAMIPHGMSNLFGVFYAVLLMFISPFIEADAFISGIMPLFMEIAEQVGYASFGILAITVPMIDITAMIRPSNARVYQVSGMLEEDYVGCLKATIVPVFLLGLVNIATAVVFGILPIG